MKRLTILAVLLVLAGCATGEVPPPPRATAPVRAVIMAPAAVQSVVGRNARALEALFGRPDLDVREGDGRKLQFIGPVCVLDAYLYPPRAGAEAVVTYIDARLPDGRDFDRGSCVAATGRRTQAR